MNQKCEIPTRFLIWIIYFYSGNEQMGADIDNVKERNMWSAV